MPLPDLIATKAKLVVACEMAGRAEPPNVRMKFRVNFSEITGKDPMSSDGNRLTGHGTVEDITSDIKQYQDKAGLDQFQMNFNGWGSLEELEEPMIIFMEQVRPAVM